MVFGADGGSSWNKTAGPLSTTYCIPSTSSLRLSVVKNHELPIVYSNICCFQKRKQVSLLFCPESKYSISQMNFRRITRHYSNRRVNLIVQRNNEILGNLLIISSCNSILLYLPILYNTDSNFNS